MRVAHALGLGLTLGLLPVPLLPVPLAAQESSEATVQRLMEEGIEFRRQGEDAEALRVFQAALALRSDARVRAQVALAHQALGHWRDAEEHLVRALADGGHPWIAGYLDTLQGALETIRAHLGWVEVDCNVEGLAIAVGGRPVGRSPLASPVRVIAGVVTVEVRIPDADPLEQTISVAPGKVERVTFAVVRDPAINAEAAVPSEPPMGVADAAPLASPVAGRSPTGPPSAAALEHTSEPGGPPVPAWTVLAASGALVTVGAVAHAVREVSAAHYNDDARCLVGDLSRLQRCGSYHSRAQVAQTVAIVGYAAGGVALATAVAFWLMEPSEHEAGPPPVTALVGPHQVFVRFGHAF